MAKIVFSILNQWHLPNCWLWASGSSLQLGLIAVVEPFFPSFLATLHGLGDLSSPTRDWTQAEYGVPTTELPGNSHILGTSKWFMTESTQYNEDYIQFIESWIPCSGIPMWISDSSRQVGWNPLPNGILPETLFLTETFRFILFKCNRKKGDLKESILKNLY